MDDDKKGKTPRLRLVLAASAFILTAAFLIIAVLRIPIGVQGQWVWKYTQGPPYGNVGIALPFFLAFLLFFYLLCRIPARYVLAGICILFVLVYCMQLSSISLGKYGLFEYPHILFIPGLAGDYFTEAAEIKDLKAYLDDFDDYIDRPYDAVGWRANTRWNVHPPGVTVIFYGVARIVYVSPRLRAFLYKASRAVSEPMEGAYSAERFIDFDASPEVAAHLVLGFLLVFLACLAVFPAYLLSRELSGQKGAILAAGLCSVIPAVFCFSPGPDQFFPTVALFILYFTYMAVKRKSVILAMAAGLAFYAGLFLSLAFLAVGAVVFFVLLFLLIKQDSPCSYLKSNCRTLLRLFIAGCAGFFIPLALMQLFAGYDTFGTILVCLKNHAQFYRYGAFRRTYLKWLGANPLDFAAFAGGSISAVFLCAIVNEFSKIGRGLRRSFNPYLVGFALAFFVLYISGKSSGEVARLWIFLMPMAAIAGLCSLGEKVSERAWLGLVLIAFQIIQVIVYRLHFDVWGVVDIIDRGELLR